MKSLLTVSLWALLASLSSAPLYAQTISYTWQGSTDSSQLVELATINNQPVNQGTGYAGAIQITNGNFLWELELPESLLPNGGSLECIVPITWGAKNWVIGDGTHAGDAYTLTGTATCGSSWGGNVPVSVTTFREMIQHRICNRGVCRTYLADTMESGSGTATIQ